MTTLASVRPVRTIYHGDRQCSALSIMNTSEHIYRIVILVSSNLNIAPHGNVRVFTLR